MARLTGLHWPIIQAFDRLRLEAPHGQSEGRGVRRLDMDEFPLHKGLRYATVVMDAQMMCILRLGEGHCRESIRPFFELLGSAPLTTVCLHPSAPSLNCLAVPR